MPGYRAGRHARSALVDLALVVLPPLDQGAEAVLQRDGGTETEFGVGAVGRPDAVLDERQSGRLVANSRRRSR